MRSKACNGRIKGWRRKCPRGSVLAGLRRSGFEDVFACSHEFCEGLTVLSAVGVGLGAELRAGKARALNDRSRIFSQA